MDYIAHIRQDDGKIQTVKEHLIEVKELAEHYGEKMDMKYLAGLAGVLHDLGKFTEEFRNYIINAVEHPDKPPKRGSVDHSTAGGKLLYEKFHTKKMSSFKRMVAEVVGNAILSHHAYLQDYISPELESKYLNRVREKVLPEFQKTTDLFFTEVMSEAELHDYVDKASKELEKYIMKEDPINSEKQAMFLTKFVFSALVDADRTNTRLFEENKESDQKSQQATEELFLSFYERLKVKIESFENQNATKSSVNRLRGEMSKQCEDFAEHKSGIYTLSIPTGGGKTLASLRYALKHALLYHKKRIIYVVPYTTIIEQNAKEVREILNDQENILEHHSNVIEDSNDDDEAQDGIMSKAQKLKLAKDNWDSPIIFTTMVQFLNVFFAKGTRNIRRLHNLSDSIIIFDEVQKVPVKCVSLFNQSLNFLKANAKSSILLCTATQPALDFVEKKLDVNSQGEIIENIDQVIESFKRVEIIDKATDNTLDNAKLADFIDEKSKEANSILVILNTKNVVRKLYNVLKATTDTISIYHLSTSMCAAHRNVILNEVRSKLRDGKKVICVSTQLIEAGVDISFECVIRSLAGLDSIAQASGRCNRHGEINIGRVYLIDHKEENLKMLREIKVGRDITYRMLIDMKNSSNAHGENLLSRKAMNFYFQNYYSELANDLDYWIKPLNKKMTELLMTPRHHNDYIGSYSSKNNEELPLFITGSYKTAADHFHVIDNVTTSVIVPFQQGKDILANLNGYERIDDLTDVLKKAQYYSVNLYQHDITTLINEGALEVHIDGSVYELKENWYSDEFGVDMDGQSELDFLIT